MNGRRRLGLQTIRRPQDGRVLGGVCAGLADRYGIDPTLLRLAFLLLALAKGIGLILYGALWLMMPAPDSRSESLPDVVRENLFGLRSELQATPQRLQSAWRRTGDAGWPRPLGRRWMALALIAVGSFVFLWSFGVFDWLSGTRILGLAAIIVGAGALVSLARGGGR